MTFARSTLLVRKLLDAESTLIFGSVGAKMEVSEAQHIEDVQNALFKVPKVHLYVLDAVIKHLKKYVIPQGRGCCSRSLASSTTLNLRKI